LLDSDSKAKRGNEMQRRIGLVMALSLATGA
jgi:hypothetical protein